MVPNEYKMNEFLCSDYHKWNVIHFQCVGAVLEVDISKLLQIKAELPALEANQCWIYEARNQKFDRSILANIFFCF